MISVLQQDRALLFIHVNTHDALRVTNIQAFTSTFSPTLGSHLTIQRTFPFHQWAWHNKEKISHIFSIEGNVSFGILFSFFSLLHFFVLSYTLHHCLHKSLTQLGLPPVSAEEIQGLPEEQSQDQRPAAPSFRVKAYHSPPSFFLPFHLISFLRQGVRI